MRKMRSVILLLLFLITTRVAYGQVVLNKPFQDCNINGSITIYDYQAKKWTFSNANDSHVATLPASTFKIINTLIFLEAGVIADKHEIVEWPGKTDTVKYGYRPDIYHDMSLKEAYKRSAGWVYVELAKKVGKYRYRDFLTSSNYGNADVSINNPDFWNFGDFAISPTNQIEILIGVYEETLPFSKKSFQILKEMMVEEQTDHYTLRAKTGWTREGGKDTGWWVGYIEKEDNVYFFATRIIKDRNSPNPNFGPCRKEITKSVLRELNVL